MADEQKIWIGQKAILYRGDGTILALRRSEKLRRHPLEWDLPGGALEYGEGTRESILREIKEETSLTASAISLTDVASGFNKIGEFWLSVCYSAKASTSDVVLSSEHIEFKWVTPREFQQLETSPRLKSFVQIFEAQRATENS